MLWLQPCSSADAGGLHSGTEVIDWLKSLLPFEPVWPSSFSKVKLHSLYLPQEELCDLVSDFSNTPLLIKYRAHF